MFRHKAEFTPESRFNDAIKELNSLLPGSGNVRERMIEWRARFAVTPDVARTIVDAIVPEVRRRTAAFVTMPPGGGVEIAFVTNKPWSGYNWYLGGYRSRIDVNQDQTIYANDLTGLIAHETYPGHHAEHALKEKALYRERGYGEHTIQLINTPECVISEGDRDPGRVDHLSGRRGTALAGRGDLSAGGDRRRAGAGVGDRTGVGGPARGASERGDHAARAPGKRGAGCGLSEADIAFARRRSRAIVLASSPIRSGRTVCLHLQQLSRRTAVKTPGPAETGRAQREFARLWWNKPRHRRSPNEDSIFRSCHGDRV